MPKDGVHGQEKRCPRGHLTKGVMCKSVCTMCMDAESYLTCELPGKARAFDLRAQVRAHHDDHSAAGHASLSVHTIQAPLALEAARGRTRTTSQSVEEPACLSFTCAENAWSNSTPKKHKVAPSSVETLSKWRPR